MKPLKKTKKTAKKTTNPGGVPTRQFPNPFRRKPKSAEQKVDDALSGVPRITNETVSEHREEVLSGARKHIYPLQHSKHSIVKISVSIGLAVILGFFILTGLSLYKFQNTGTFIYDVTRIVPFPVAKVNSSWVSYESYLFELRHNMHYYKTQQQANFNSKDGKVQLERLKKQALAQVILDAKVKQIAKQNDISVSNQAVDEQIELLKSQNRLGNSDRVFKDVLSEFWGWNVADFRRTLKQQLLQQAVVAKLDKPTVARADNAQKQLIAGKDFASVATQYSDDIGTKANGGIYPNAITVGSRDIHPTLTNEMFKLKANQISSIIKAGNSLEIVKVIDNNGTTVHAAHIQFNLGNINVFIKPGQNSKQTQTYIKV